MNGGQGDNSSHDEPDVLYIAFSGRDAVPGADGADWTAESFDAFHESLRPLGDELIKRIQTKEEGDVNFEFDCSWPGHCLGMFPHSSVQIHMIFLTRKQGQLVQNTRTAPTILLAEKANAHRLR